MKKNILYSMLFALVALVMASCGDKESEGLSRLTYYPSIQLKGETYMVWDKGVAFEDPGYVSEMNGEDVTSQVTISGSVDVNKSGIYNLTYTTCKNDDGFDASASRTVVVLDPNSAIEGFYTNLATSNRNGTAYGKPYQVLVIDNGDGTVSVDDLLGGWYCQRAGYGTKYAMQGTLGVAEDGTLTLIDSFVPGWGDSADTFEGKYDAAANTINFVLVYAGSLTFTETWVKD